MDNYGVLFLIATPIGNMGDITLRALETLKACDYVAAEDTRRTLKLLIRYDIKKPLISCHEHNEAVRAGELAALLKSGKNVALVTDAGMPSVSDPGMRIVSECVKLGLPVTACPGACAAVTALALSGFYTERFVFEGFLPRKAKERRERLEELKAEKRTLVLYEAPHRLVKTLAELRQFLGERQIAIARELTKIHEEVLRTTFTEAISVFSEREPKGEFVLVIAGYAGDVNSAAHENGDIYEIFKRYVSEGVSEMDAIKKTAKDLGVPKRKVYGEIKCKTS